MKLNIVYSTRYGQTRKIAECIKIETEKRRGDFAELFEISADGDCEKLSVDCDLIVIGAPIYLNRFPKGLIDWARSNRASLQKTGLALFMVSLNVAGQTLTSRKKDRKLLEKFVCEVGVVPTHIASFPGALKYREYNWLLRNLMRWISYQNKGPTATDRDHELTNWDEVRQFARDIQDRNPESGFCTHVQIPQLRI